MIQVEIGGNKRSFVCGEKSLYRIRPVCVETRQILLEYSGREERGQKAENREDWNRERERLKEQLISYLKEAVKKQWKEQQEYYRSRPSLAAKHFESLFYRSSMEKAMTAEVTEQIYARMEERMRREWLRQGRG